jgi:hypothetical protein
MGYKWQKNLQNITHFGDCRNGLSELSLTSASIKSTPPYWYQRVIIYQFTQVEFVMNESKKMVLASGTLSNIVALSVTHPLPTKSVRKKEFIAPMLRCPVGT